MATGQLEKLSNLDHPANPNRRQSIMNVGNEINNPTPFTSDPINTDPPTVDLPKPRRLSLMGHRRRSSAANTNSPTHSRKTSLSQIPTPQTMIIYPGSRFDIANYVRDIVSKMLILDPVERAELIAVAVKVPKEFVFKGTRPLVELAWLDYKDHVGPYAGMGLGAEHFKDDDASSVYSGISSLSQSFTGLLSGRSAKNANDSRGRYSGW